MNCWSNVCATAGSQLHPASRKVRASSATLRACRRHVLFVPDPLLFNPFIAYDAADFFSWENRVMRAFFLALSLIGLSAFCTSSNLVGHDTEPRRRALVSESVVAGGPKDYLEVRHLVLRGTNAEIGKALGEIAKERLKVPLGQGVEPLRTRAQRKYFERNYPAHFERMQGVAAAYGQRVEDDTINFSALSYPRMQFGCSVVHLPPSSTTDGKSVVSRNYDFSLGTLRGTKPGPGEEAATTKPFLVEMHPDRGYASLAIHAYDLLGGTIDGINSEGLTVAILADDELMSQYRMEGTFEPAAGLGVLQTARYLLDMCANVEEAKEALLQVKHYYEFIPCHYLIADRHGKAFVWEFSHAHNKEYIVENPGKPLFTTNFSLHRYMENGKPPSAEKVRKVCSRYCLLAEKLAAGEKITTETLQQAHKQVDATQPIPTHRAGGRTIWHALYYPEERKVRISFYLRDEKDGDGKMVIRRSDYREFTLGK